MKLNHGAPAVPRAQLVIDPDKNQWGVAVQGGRYVCQLPKEYAGEGLELAITDQEGIIVIHPDHPPLAIDPLTGTTRPL